MPQDWKEIPALTDLQRFNLFEKVDIGDPDGCHLWTGTMSDSGYGIFMLQRGRFKATRVVYFAVTGIDPGPMLLRHTCDVKSCVRFDHLIPGTNDENMRDAVDRGRFASGKRNGAHTHPERMRRGEGQVLSKLKDEQVVEARKLYSGGMKCEAVAQHLGVTLDVASKIIRGILWKHVGGPVVSGSLPKTGKRDTYGVMNQEKADAIREDKQSGMDAMSIAAKYDVSRASVYKIIQKKRWA